MAISVTGLTGYVEERRLPLIKQAVLDAKSAQLFNLQTGIKSKAKINLLSTEVVFGDGSSCGWDEAGTSTLSQREIEVGNIKVNMSFCDRTLLDTWAGYEVKVAAGKEKLPFEEYFVNSIIENVNSEVEKAIWQGNTTSGTGNLAAFDGLLTILASEASVIAAGATGATATVFDVYSKIPAESLKNASIVLGTDAFRALVLDLMQQNLYHYNPVVDGEMQITLPGTSTKVYGVAGLNGTSKVVAADLKNNVFFGTDMEDDKEVFDLWYSKDNQEFRLAIKFNAGVQVAFPDQVVLGTISANSGDGK